MLCVLVHFIVFVLSCLKLKLLWKCTAISIYVLIRYPAFLSSLRPSTTVLSEYGQRREIVEDADFEALEWKLRGCKVSCVPAVLFGTGIIFFFLNPFQITDSLRNLFAQL